VARTSSTWGVSGEGGVYTFNVTVSSPDAGCETYADWWEVVTADGELVYRRTLLHDHTDEQPFTRSGSPVGIEANDVVVVRAHMNTTGYGPSCFSGSAASGFVRVTLAPDFGAAVETLAPLPPDCDS
jgi:hypothetical protein